MSQAEELLNSLASGTTYSADPATEPHIVIGADRYIIVPDELKNIAVQFDHDIETVTFDCPRYWDEHDMSKMSVWINFMRADGEMDSAPGKNVRVNADDESVMHFDWTISRNVTEVQGSLQILVCIKKADESGNEKNHWNSQLNNDLYVSEGMEVQETVIAAYPDIVEHLLLRMSEVENKTTRAYILNCVEQYLDEDPSVIIEHIESIIADQPIQEFVEAYLDDYVDIGTTESRTLENSYAGAYEMVSMAGVSEQKTLEGKNLLNLNATPIAYFPNTTYEVIGDVIKVTTKASTSGPYQSVNYTVEVSPNTTYTVHADSITTSNSSYKPAIRICKNASESASDIITTVNSNALTKTFTTDAETTSVGLFFYASYGTTPTADTTATFTNVQIEAGEVATEYEPYCGAKASPNPEYPQEIKSVGPEVTVKTVGKNLFDINGEVNAIGSSSTSTAIPNTVVNGELVCGVNNANTASRGQLIRGLAGKTITFSAKCTSFGTGTGARIYIYENKENVGSKDCVLSQTTSITYTCTTDEVVFTFSTVAGTNSKFAEIQIEAGEVATPYEPYQESSAQITLPEPLRGIGDVRDIIEKRAGRWGVERRWKKTLFDATKFAEISKTNYENATFFSLPKPTDSLVYDQYLTVSAMCNKFRCDNIYPLDQLASVNNTSTSASSGQIWFGFAKGTTLAEAQATGEFEYIYQLATPTWEELPEEYQNVLDNLQVYDGVTYISVDSTVQPIVVSKYGTSEVGARTLTNTNRIEKLEEEDNSDDNTLAEVNAVLEAYLGGE